jgi:hypothetical protein
MAANKGYDFNTDDLEFMRGIFTPIQKLKTKKFKL